MPYLQQQTKLLLLFKYVLILMFFFAETNAIFGLNIYCTFLGKYFVVINSLFAVPASVYPARAGDIRTPTGNNEPAWLCL